MNHFDFMGQIGAGVKANLAMEAALTAWEQGNLATYGLAIHTLFEAVSKEDLIKGLEHRGWRFWVDTEAVGQPLKIARIQ